MALIEVPEFGTVLVESGVVRDVHREDAVFQICWCKDKAHRSMERFQRPRPYRGQEPHMIGTRMFELVWSVPS